MFVTMKEMLADAREKKYAIPAFDVSNYEMIKSVIEVCEEEKSPAMFMCLKADLENKGIHFLTALLQEAAKNYSVPVCVHLDHATDFNDIKQAIDAGFSSVMYDGSVLPFEKNAENTKIVVDMAHAKGVSVEAELGHVCDAIAGTGEDAMMGNADAKEENPEDSLTDPLEVEKFVDITNVDALAVAIGTAHGVYRSTPTLRLDRLDEINKISKIPLVLHGGSGTPDDQVKQAIARGITKINIFSEVLNGLNTGLKDKLNNIQNMSMWPIFVYEEANARMREVIRNKIRTFGSNGRV
ncbi:MAG: class II fructose-bisphosphate aldolase [Clostridia bacterium]|nr:class II fructose-bisphosphate aldolase [Clostridia bacterium]